MMTGNRASAGSAAFRTGLRLVAVGAILLASGAKAKVFDEAGVSAPFLKIAQGARASAMGEAFTAVADDSTAVFWNPGGLAQVSRVEAEFTYNRWISGFNQNYFGLVFPYGGTWSAAYSMMDLGTFAETDSSSNPTGNTFSVNESLVMLGYGRGFYDDTVLAGASVKMIKEDMGDGITSRAVTVSVGVLGLPLWNEPRVAVGAVVENISGEVTGFRMPMTLRTGVSWRRSGILFQPTTPSDVSAEEGIESVGKAYSRYPWEVGGGFSDSLTLAADVLAPFQGRVELHGGLEYWISIVALRVGYRYRFPRNELGGMSGLTLGLGFRGRGFRFDYGFDYSYAPYGELGDANRFSVSVTF